MDAWFLDTFIASCVAEKTRVDVPRYLVGWLVS
jgi:hypothetical protein